jgi:pimeloyl-ACP methyl ester carboxylesterase
MDRIFNLKLADVLRRNAMKKILLMLLVLSACTGHKYATMSALEFEAIEYGFPVKKLPGSPEIAYIDAGSGPETLVLIHGLASNAGFWRYVIPELSKNYRVIAVDLPGYGKSGKRGFPVSLTYYADQIARLAEELQLGKIIPVGHSMGGQISMHLALRYPDKVKKLVLASPAGVEKFSAGEGKWLRNVFRIDDLTLASEEAVRVNLNRNFYTWNNRYEWLVEERVRMAKAADFDGFANSVIKCVGAMIDEPTYAKLGDFEHQTLVIYGRHDGLIPNPFLHPGRTSDVFKKGVKAMKNGTLVEIDKAGHMVQMEQPDAFVDAVRSFLK